MLPHLTAERIQRRTGHDDAYWGRPSQPSFQAEPFLSAYLAGYQIGREQRRIELCDHSHPSLKQFEPVKRRAS